MLKFFRSIRRNLIANDKFGKYLKYAFGEIILVVIGILIALQINNLNQKRQDRDYELKMLQEICRTLKSDRQYLDEMYRTYDGLDKTADYFMELCKNKVPFQDSLFGRIFDLNNSIQLHYNAGPYEGLKSSGLDRVSHDSIRNALTTLYDFELPRLADNLEHITRNHQRNIDSMLVLFGHRFIDDSRGVNTVGWDRVPVDLFQQQGFLQLLAGVSWRGKNARRAVSRFTPKVDEIIRILEKEVGLI